MKNTKAKFYVLVISVGLFGIVPATKLCSKISMLQPDFVVNKSVEAIQIVQELLLLNI
jgi:hypothetical protein